MPGLGCVRKARGVMIRCLIGLLSAVAATLIALNFNVGSAASAQRPKPQACEASKD